MSRNTPNLVYVAVILIPANIPSVAEAASQKGIVKVVPNCYEYQF
jgi:hypothetical protein